MLFNSYEFLFAYLPVVWLLYFLLGQYFHRPKASAYFLFLASLIFYGYWDYHYVPLLLGSICFNYLISLRVDCWRKRALQAGSSLLYDSDVPSNSNLPPNSNIRSDSNLPPNSNIRSDFNLPPNSNMRSDSNLPPNSNMRSDSNLPSNDGMMKKAKCWLITGILGDVALLGYFKYTDFFLGTLNALGGSFPLQHIILPLGISFFTFTQIAYIVDVYRGEAKVAQPGIYGLFVTIFPHLIAGPIINYKQVMPQLVDTANYRINWSNVSLGLFHFTAGLFKKVVIADNIAELANRVFAVAGVQDMLTSWLGALGYTLQLYFDFCGYSEMAVGLGLMFNIRLPWNFETPYRSTTLIDFWRRWHMTLGAWVKSYLYIPLGGNRRGQTRKMLNLFISMFIIGLWHGAGWTFVVWGMWHGVGLMINHTWRYLGHSMPRLPGLAITFLTVVIGWVLFRAKDFTQAYNMLYGMFDFSSLAMTADPADIFQVVLLLLLVWFFPNPHRLAAWFKPNGIWLVIMTVLWCIIFYDLSRISDFLYFQF